MQACYPMIGDQPNLVAEVHKEDRVEGSRLCQGTSAWSLNIGIEVFRQETGDIVEQGRRLMGF